MHSSAAEMLFGGLILVVSLTLPAAMACAGAWGAAIVRRHAVGALAARPEVRLTTAGFACVAMGGLLSFAVPICQWVLQRVLRRELDAWLGDRMGDRMAFLALRERMSLVAEVGLIGTVVGAVGVVLLAWGCCGMLRARQEAQSPGEALPVPERALQTGGDGDGA